MKNHVLLSFVSMTVLSIGIAQAESITNLGDLPGGTTANFATSISTDGTVIVGVAGGVFGNEAFRWTQGGGMVGLGDLPGGATSSGASDVSADGSVVVGTGDSTHAEAFRWTQGGGMVGLGDLPGGAISSDGRAVNADGTVVVGGSISAGGTEAFRWTQGGGMVGLGDLAGGFYFSRANDVSADGSVVIGQSWSASGLEAFRWTQGGGMVGLGDLAGGSFLSEAQDTNVDGSVIVGTGISAGGGEAFIWTQGGGMVGLGDLAGGLFASNAYGVNEDGSVVVGRGSNASGFEAIRWTQATGMESLSSLLAAAGVDLTGWTLSAANESDSSGNLIVGQGVVGGNNVAFLANLTTGGLTTPTDLVIDLIPATIPVQQTFSQMNQGVGQSLLAATQSISTLQTRITNIDFRHPDDIAPAAGGDEVLESLRTWSVYAVGSFGMGQDNEMGNHDVNGTTGIIIQMDKNLALGLGVVGSSGIFELARDGESQLDSIGTSMIAAYESDSGIRLYGTAFVSHLELKTDRHYLNGGGTDSSVGETDGMGYGGAVRAGFNIDTTDNTQIMPYVEIQATKTSLDGYTETGGGFPATFGDQDGHQVTSRLGTQVTYDITPNLNVGVRGAWAHRIADKGGDLSASTTGFTGVLTSTEGDKDWAEGTVITSWQAAPETRLTAEITGRSGQTQDPQISMTVGLKMGF